MSSSQEIVLSLSRSLPLFIIEEYEKLLAIINIKLPPNPSQLPNHRFWDLFNAHAAQKGSSLEVAVTYLHTILNRNELESEDLKVFIKSDVKIDGRVIEALQRIKNERPKLLDSLGDQLGEYQLSRYRLAVTVLTERVLIPPELPFLKIYDILLKKCGSYPAAIAFTIGVLERSGWGDTRRLKPFADRSIDFNTQFSEVDLCLTVADYYGNMSDRDFSSAKVYTSAVHLKNLSVSNKNRIEFTLLLMKRNVISVGNVSNIEDKVRYPIFFKEYKRRSEDLPEEPAPGNLTTPEQATKQDTNTSTTTDLSSTASECTKDTEQSSINNITVSHPTTATAATSSETTQSSGTTAALPVIPDAVLDSAPQMMKVVKFLKPFESQWRMIRLCLEVDLDEDELVKEYDKSSCLAAVLKAWQKSSPGSVPYTWRSVIDVADALGDDNAKRNIETFLLKQ
ncbi:PREDICTED: uncharacterized protein LOC100633603 isoform X2 [Amphimedon queenslandica]|uniref:Death domain-containing protein n=1 Tax=Amphimedon queenslandica TaxID=400682 RepID=A0A1X7TV76_AMPQE|nr:PREDICTED: uncharacterized protein LOC100633603 isoform X2 [Amphimedon queenslandica]|eukprot:XP_011406733.1 PREDICTED: uncharacterized protein LOC100633603 isoform X2 [Amphimedon queenslandica]